MNKKIIVSFVSLVLLLLVEGIFSFTGNSKLKNEFLDDVEVLIKSQVVGTLDLDLETDQQTSTPTTVGATESALVTRVVDADTIELSTKEKVRYIGINAPETKHPTKDVECYGEVASKKNTELVEGKQVRLEKDVSNTDRYGRLLRYVYLKDDQTGKEIFVNEYLVREGYAVSSSYPPDVKYQELFKQAETEARELKKGLWGSECN